MRKKRRNPRIGSSIDDFLREEGVLQAFRAVAIKEVIAWQLRRSALRGQTLVHMRGRRPRKRV
jgi:hypothetical protein